MPNEQTTLKNATDRYLKSLKPAVWYRKKWGGGVYQHKGDPDYFVCAWGKFITLEAKHPTRKTKLEPEQNHMREQLEAAGALHYVYTSVEQLAKMFEVIRQAYE